MTKKAKQIFNRHDHFFAQQMKDKNVAKDFFKSYLPESFKKDIDFNSIELEQLDAKLIRKLGLTNKVADILFKMQFKKSPAFFLLHIEHQSTDDRFMSLRMLTYIANILTNYLDANKDIKKLPPIIGLVYYHGIKRPYPYSMKFVDLFEDLTDEQKQYILNPVLIDLSVLSDEILLTHGDMAPVDTLMKHSYDECTHNLLIQLLKTIKKSTVQMQENCVKYIESNYDYEPEEFFELIKEQLNEVDIMTIQQRIEERSARKNSEQIARNLLSAGLESELIAKSTGLDLKKIEEIKETLH